ERGHDAGRSVALTRGQGNPQSVRLVLDELGRTCPEQLEILRLARGSLERLVILPREFLGRLLRGQSSYPANHEDDASQNCRSNVHDALLILVARFLQT